MIIPKKVYDQFKGKDIYINKNGIKEFIGTIEDVGSYRNKLDEFINAKNEFIDAIWDNWFVKLILKLLNRRRK